MESARLLMLGHAVFPWESPDGWLCCVMVAIPPLLVLMALGVLRQLLLRDRRREQQRPRERPD